MMTFPLDGRAKFVVIEPGNIERLKQGKPLRIGDEVLIAFTPDMQHFAQLLGVSGELPAKGTQMEYHTSISGEQLDAALKACQHRREIIR